MEISFNPEELVEAGKTRDTTQFSLISQACVV